MRCPFCNYEDTKVIDSRTLDDNTTRRRRECDRCNKRFTTYEKLETSPIFVIKKNNAREPFDKEKLKRGILNSCAKRPIPIKEIDYIVDDIERELMLNENSEIKSILIGEMVLERLKKLDDVAYIRFASVYRNFEEIKNFKDAVSNLNPKKDNQKS